MLRRLVKLVLSYRKSRFSGSEAYWVRRYAEGGHSGSGSYNHLAAFKAKVINEFVRANSVESIIELGCGDGNQLKLSNYPWYVGFDVSPAAIDACRKIFADDNSKKFKLINDYSGDVVDLSISLDVIYHLVEDEIYLKYMELLFGCSSRYVIIYSSNFEQDVSSLAPHVRHRKFTDWVDENQKDWELIGFLENPYACGVEVSKVSSANFFFFKNKNFKSCK